MINNSQRSLRALTILAAALVVFAALSGRTANAVDTKSLYERLGGYDEYRPSKTSSRTVSLLISASTSSLSG